jgi:hypothetical protein
VAQEKHCAIREQRRAADPKDERMFPADPNAPRGPERSEYVRRGYVDRASARERFATLDVRRQEEARSAGVRRAA